MLFRPLHLLRLLRPLRLLYPLLAWPFSVLPVVGDVEAGAFEYQACPTGDLADSRLPADRTLGAGFVRHFLEFFEGVPVRALIFVGRHARPLEMNEISLETYRSLQEA